MTANGKMMSGSSIILHKGNKSLIISPTMLLPQNVSNTKNVYYDIIVVLYNILINTKEDIKAIDIIFTSFFVDMEKWKKIYLFNKL
jgi:hypothetical protein